VFTALVGSKYAAIPAAGLSTGSVIDHCRMLVDAHADIPEDGKVTFRSALDDCADGARRRNRVIHDAWARRPGGSAVTLRSRATTSVPTLAEAARPPSRRQVPGW